MYSIQPFKAALTFRNGKLEMWGRNRRGMQLHLQSDLQYYLKSLHCLLNSKALTIYRRWYIDILMCVAKLYSYNRAMIYASPKEKFIGIV